MAPHNCRRGDRCHLISRECTTCKGGCCRTSRCSPQDVLLPEVYSQLVFPYTSVGCGTLLQDTYDECNGRYRCWKVNRVETICAHIRCPLMQSGQSSMFGCSVVCFMSVQLEKSMHWEWAGSHDHHLQSVFLPQNLWQDSASPTDWKFTEYSCKIKELSAPSYILKLTKSQSTWHCPKT